VTARLPLTPVAAALAGVALFFFLFDPRLLDPGYVAWLMDGDPGTMYLGWRFFRAEDWGWPPGAMHAYGLDIASSIVYTDSIPLAALPAKLISSWLPTTFQYFGWWMLACYALQGWFGGMLADLAAERPLQRLAIALIFVASIPVMDRAIGHYALMSHWLVLWALWLALRPHREHATLAWTAVACLASLVHAYLLYLVLAVWVADIVRRRHFDPEPRTSFAAAFRHVVVVGIALWIVMTIAGYFTLPRSAISGGVEYYGRFATNLNAFVNPQWGSRFLPNWPVIPGSELEGQAYLGLGVLVLLAVALIALLKPGGPSIDWKPYVPLIVVSIGLLALAITHKVALGDRVLVELPVPDKLLDTLATLRASGRLAWVAFYGLIFAAGTIVATRFTPFAGTVIIIGALVLQALDLSPRFEKMREYFADRTIAVPAKRASPLASPFWAEAAKDYRIIRVAPAANMARGWLWFGQLAADHGMAVNTGLVARVDSRGLSRANEALASRLKDGPLAADTLYVLWSPEQKFAWTIGPDDGVAFIDGFVVIAPGWFTKPRGSIAPHALTRGPMTGVSP